MFRLDEFLRVSRDVELPNGEVVMMRILSDLEMNARRDYALSEAMRVTDQLKNPESDLYKTKILPLQDSALDTLVDLMAQSRMYELERESRDLFKLDFVVPRDNPTLEEEIDTEKKQSDLEIQVYKDRAKYILDGLESYKAKVAELPRDTLLKELHARAIQAYTYAASRDSELYYTVWCSTEVNGKKKWKSVDEIHQLQMSVIDRLYNLYKELDSIDPWEITKSQSEGLSDRVGQDVGKGTESTSG